jgi:peptidoglycan/xylan/chitin deacetylase (PgdA/CDA1 family)
MEMDKAFTLFEDIFGHRAGTMAAPGWTVTGDSLEIQDSLQLAYCSDSRGRAPFYPVLDGRRFATLQIPTTWPTMDELLGEGGITGETINDHYLSLVKPGLNVHTIHAELEGNVMASRFSDLLQRLLERGARFITLLEAAGEFGGKAAESSIAMGELPGRVGGVALQDATSATST